MKRRERNEFINQFTGRSRLVSGASRGIGRSIAEPLGSGATVGTATSEKGAEAITAYLREAGIAKGMVLNVADKASIDTVVKAVGDEFGGISVLVNNAGITRDNLLMRMKDDEWDDIITI